MIIPPFIKPGSLVGLVTPAGKIPPGLIKQAELFLEHRGFRHVRGSHSGGAWHQFGGKDHERARDMVEMLQNPEVEVIWCSRGGYGTLRLMDKVDFSGLVNKPKWVVGFSDITVLHACLQNRHGLVSIHGPMPKNLGEGHHAETGVDVLWDMLGGNVPAYNVEPHPLNRYGKSSGILGGGNLTLLSILKGSDYDFNPGGKILFIEDVGEYLYSIDRMIRGLDLSGKLSGLAGLIVGQMTDLQDNQTPFGFTAYEIIAETVKKYDYPVIFNFPAGHSKPNIPLMLGARVKLDVTGNFVSISYSPGNFTRNGQP